MSLKFYSKMEDYRNESELLRSGLPPACIPELLDEEVRLPPPPLAPRRLWHRCCQVV